MIVITLPVWEFRLTFPQVDGVLTTHATIGERMFVTDSIYRAVGGLNLTRSNYCVMLSIR